MVSPAQLLFHHGRIHTGAAVAPQGWVLVAEGRIAACGEGEPPSAPEAERIDLEGGLLASGLVDLHVHGAVGHDTMDATLEALKEMARFYARHGVTGFLATTMAAPHAAVMAALGAVAEAMRQGTDGAALLGAHVEGPYVDVRRAGAQAPDSVRRADPAEYDEILQSGVVRLITLAPEFAENEQLIRSAVAQGVTVAGGHTRASYEQIERAVALGMSQVTHLFNGMEPLHHREPGVVGAALSMDAIHCELIADLIHLHPAVLKLAVRAKGYERVLLVTDAMRGTGMPDGAYDLGGQRVIVREGSARLASGALAGSTLTLDRAVRNMHRVVGVPLEQVLAMATANPARRIGLGERKGRIAPGVDADLIVLDEGLEVTLTMVGGRIVYRTG